MKTKLDSTTRAAIGSDSIVCRKSLRFLVLSKENFVGLLFSSNLTYVACLYARRPSLKFSLIKFETRCETSSFTDRATFYRRERIHAAIHASPYYAHTIIYERLYRLPIDRL